ncbi:MAG TPA: radical SAM protein [Stellaceae bacterium]|nr:radical SAM protein [Stellaceae bacterium]
MNPPDRAIDPPADAPLAYRFRSAAGEHLLIVPFTRIFDLSATDAAALDRDGGTLDALAGALGRPAGGEAPLEGLAEPAPQSLSLNVSASCNLSCGYCYAGRGGFAGAQPKPMTWPVARAAIDRLFAAATADAPITIGFLGGEPFANRPLIHRAVVYAAEEGRRRGCDVRFSVTTNGTLLRPADLELLRRHPFAVTISLDGPAAVNDAQRPDHRGGGTWRLAAARIAGLLAAPGRAKPAARATVTRHDLDLCARLEALAALGFPEIGFAPLRVGPETSGPLREQDWPRYLEALIGTAQRELARVRQGLPIRLTNLAVALKQLHRGASSPYPCGAGGGYFSVAADGRWYACHRAVGDPAFELGSNDGLDPVRRRNFLAARHVHAQTECGRCWARYLCSGGCHQEAPSRTAASCDFVRDWLTFCLRAYCELGAPARGATPP